MLEKIVYEWHETHKYIHCGGIKNKINIFLLYKIENIKIESNIY